MAVITFTSDFGYRDAYVAAVKARIITLNQGITVIDISHQIEMFNVAHAAYVLKSVFRDFPKSTVHLVSVNAPSSAGEKPVALKLEEHYFVGMDNGLFSLLSEKSPTAIVELTRDNTYSPVFPEKTALASAAVALASGISIYNLGKQIGVLKSMKNMQVKAGPEEIYGHIVHVDVYGNLITDIHAEVFKKYREGRNFSIRFGRETADVISDSYNSASPGDYVALFNSAGYLEIAINQGNASELLGLIYGHPVVVNFQMAADN